MEEVTSENRFKCHICEKTFNRKDHFKNHERIHTGEKPFQCDICKASFAVKSSLVRHKRTHTGEKPFICEICGKTFLRKYHLNQHLKVHTRENLYCDICGRNFIRKSNLTQHLKVHTSSHDKSLNLVSCDLCGVINIYKVFHDKICPGNEKRDDTASLSHTTDNYGASSSSQNIETNTGHIPTQFVDCGPTIKEEIKEENVEFHDPLRLSYAVQSLDEPVTYEEFFV